MNKVSLIGRVSRDVSMKKIPNGKEKAAFSIAVQRKKKKSGEDNGADFFYVIAFDGAAKIAYKYLDKGMRVGISGHLHQYSITDKDTNKTYSCVEVIAEDIDLLEFRDANEDSEEPFTYDSVDEEYPTDSEVFPEEE